MIQSIFLFFVFLSSPFSAQAFDRVFCQSQMDQWIVTLTEENRTAVLTPYHQSATLTSQQSEVLLIKNTDNMTVASVFPWNGLYVRAGKEVKEKYSIDSSEAGNGFEVAITEKATNKIRRLSCRFTF